MSEQAKPRVLVTVGTRPEAIKMLPVIRALHASALLEPLVVSTGQHVGLVDEVLALAGLRADIDLRVGRPGLTLNELFASVMRGLEQACRERFGPPESVLEHGLGSSYPVGMLVHGDTSSAAAAALAAFHLRIPVAHVEAGLRTHMTASPFPEELNRQLIARIAAFHLAPTSVSEENLILEGVRYEQIFVTGNTAIDALLWASDLDAPSGVPEVDAILRDPARRLVVVTAHRRENLASGALGRIAAAVAETARRHPEVVFVLPLHPNPAVGAAIRPALEPLGNVVLTAPLPYIAFAKLLRQAYLVITDSGGIQEEAPALGTPVLVTRETTERGEGVEAGTLQLVGTETTPIVRAVETLLTDQQAHTRMAESPNPYGDGLAAARIVAALEHLAFRTPKPTRFGSGYQRSTILRAAGFTDPSGS